MVLQPLASVAVAVQAPGPTWPKMESVKPPVHRFGAAEGRHGEQGIGLTAARDGHAVGADFRCRQFGYRHGIEKGASACVDDGEGVGSWREAICRRAAAVAGLPEVR